MKVDTGIASKPSGKTLKMGDLVTINGRNQEDLCVVVGIYSPLDVNVISLKDGWPYTVYRLDLNLFEGTAEISNDL